MILADGTEISRATVSPHKFGGDPMAEYLYVLNLDSSFDRITGDACDWFYIVSQYGKRLLFNDSQGFVWVIRHATEAEASAHFDLIDADYSATEEGDA
jgi:hypothetical protein